MKISVIIVSYNAESYIGRCIQSINQHLSHMDHEIIVIDNDSKDNTAGYVAKNFPGVILIKNNVNLGFGAANNKAVKKASGNILVLANPDTQIVTPIDPLINTVLRPNTGAVFGRLKYPDGTDQVFIRNFPGLRNQFFEILKFPLAIKQFSGFGEMIRTNNEIYENGGTIPAGSGAFFVMKKEIFEKFGGFDEDYFIYGEETDLFFRMQQQRFFVQYHPDVVIVHHHGKSTAGNAELYVMLQKNRSLFIKKNYSYLKYFLFRKCFQFTYDFTRLYSSGLSLLLNFKRPDPYYKYRFRRHWLAAKWAWFSI